MRLYAALQGRYLRPYWPLVLLLGVLLLGMTALQLVPPQIVRHFIDTAQEQGALRSLYLAAAAFLGVGVMSQTFRAVATYIGRDVAWRATNRLRSDLTVHVLRLDMGFHGDHTPGELLERIDGDVERLANFFSQFLIQIVGALLLLAGLVVVTWLEDWRFGLAVAGFASFYLATQTRLVRFIAPLWRKENATRADLFGLLGEQISGIADTQKSGAVSFAMRRFYESFRKRILAHLKALFVTGTAINLSMTLNGMRLAVGLAVAVYLFQRGDITIGTAYLGFHYLYMIGLPVVSITREFGDLQMASASILRVNELMGTTPKIRDGPREDLPSEPLPVEFQHVSFSYSPESHVLRDISFRLEAGKTLGVLGRTGSGKTTLSRLLFRFYDPDEGSVRLGDVDVSELSLDRLRSQVGLVTQEVQLFQATLRDNLTLFDASISDESIESTLESLGLGNWLCSLPNGLDTELSSGDGQLSAGESQLLAFARVFLRNPSCIVLDEASSRLDPATEALIQRAVDELLDGRTAIVIAHRLTTVQSVDEIMIIEGGSPVEYGQRAELADDPSSRFSGLLRTGLEESFT